MVPTWQALTLTLAPVAAGEAPAQGLLPACSAPPPPGASPLPAECLLLCPPSRGRPLCSPRPQHPVRRQQEPLPACSFLPRTAPSVLTPAAVRRGCSLRPHPSHPTSGCSQPTPLVGLLPSAMWPLRCVEELLPCPGNCVHCDGLADRCSMVAVQGTAPSPSPRPGTARHTSSGFCYSVL